MKKITIAFFGILFLGICSCSKEPVNLSLQQDETISLTTEEKIMLCEKILVSQEFTDLKNLLGDMAIKLYPRDERKLDIPAGSMEELTVWVNENIENTSYNSINEFVKGVERIQSVIQLVKHQYSDILSDEGNYQFLSDFVNESMRNNEDNAMVIMSAATCFSALNTCLGNAQQRYDDMLAVVAVSGLINLMLGISVAMYTYAEYRDAISDCQTTFLNCK